MGYINEIMVFRNYFSKINSLTLTLTNKYTMPERIKATDKKPPATEVSLLPSGIMPSFWDKNHIKIDYIG